MPNKKTPATVVRADGFRYDAAEGFRIYESPHLDAAENYFFSRELEHISKAMHSVAYVQGLARKLLPINNEMDPAKMSFTWRLWDQFGQAKRLADDGADVNQVGVKGEENNQTMQVYALGYNFTEDEIRAAASAGRPLERDRAQACRDGIERQFNDLATDGDTAGNITGFLGVASPATKTPSSKASGSAVGGTSWLDSSGNLVATAAEIIDDVGSALRQVFVDSKEIERPTRVVLPTAQYSAIEQTPRGTGTDTTILTFLKAANPGVEFLSWERLKYISAALNPNLTSSKDRMICYDPRPDRLEFLLPIEFEQQAPQLVNYRYKVNCRMKAGGVVAYRPKSILFADGI